MRSLLLVFLSVLAVASSARADQGKPPAEGASPAYYFLLGRHYEGLGRIDEAIAALGRAIELSPSSAELRAELAGLYARQGKTEEAISAAEAALAKDPANREANRVLGSVYAELAQESQPLRPGDDPSGYAARATAALEKARDGEADVALDLTLGRLYIQQGAFDKAIPLLQRIVVDQPGYAEGALLLAAAQEGAGRIAEATETIEGSLQSNPRFYRGQLRLAELYERQQRWKDAADAYATAQALNPRAPALGNRRLAALINGGQAALARDLLEKQLAQEQTDAPDPVRLYLLAEAQRATKDLDAAEATARTLLAVDPQDVRGLHVLALILQDKGDAPGAERVLRDLIAKDPLDANALNSLGYMLAERGERLDEAVTLLQRALKIEPDNPSYLDSLGWAYFQQGRLDLADPPLTQAAASLKESSVVQDHLGDLRYRQQRYSEAAEAWKRALAGDGQAIDRAKIERKLREALSRMERR